MKIGLWISRGLNIKFLIRDADPNDSRWAWLILVVFEINDTYTINLMDEDMFTM